MTPLRRMRLYQLASQALPIGGYSHSHGLEAAIDAGVVGDEATLAAWLGDLLRFSVGSYEAPLLALFCAAWATPDVARIEALNAEFLATRETAELRLLLAQLPDIPPATLAVLDATPEPALPCVWAAATAAWGIDTGESLLAWLWSWAENQVLVALKAVPLGQSAGQRVLGAIAPRLAACAAAAAAADVPRPRSNFSPALAILSSRHETQYSRLFRS
jgi:urease accessory protein